MTVDLKKLAEAEGRRRDKEWCIALLSTLDLREVRTVLEAINKQLERESVGNNA